MVQPKHFLWLLGLMLSIAGIMHIEQGQAAQNCEVRNESIR